MAKKRYYSENKAERKAGVSAKTGATAGHAGEMFGSVGNYHSNMPDYVMMKQYSKNPYESNSLDDTITGIDHQMSDDVNQASRHRSKTKY